MNIQSALENIKTACELIETRLPEVKTIEEARELCKLAGEAELISNKIICFLSGDLGMKYHKFKYHSRFAHEIRSGQLLLTKQSTAKN